MPYSSPQPSSVQWQAQTRIRSAPHSPTLRPRTSPPESVEDLSFPEEENPIVLPSISKAAPPASAPVSAFATIPPVKAPPRPAPQRSQTPGSPPKLPVSNASATKSRSKEQGQASGLPSTWGGPPEKSKPVSGTTVTLVPQTVDDKSPVNGIKQSAVTLDTTLTNGVHKPVINGVSKQLIESLQHVEAASSAPQSQAPQGPETQLATSAARHSDADSAAVDLDKAVIIAANPTGSNQTAEGPRKANPLKAFMLRMLSCCNRDRF